MTAWKPGNQRENVVLQNIILFTAEFLLGKGYEMHGIKHRAFLLKPDRIEQIYRRFPEERVRFFVSW